MRIGLRGFGDISTVASAIQQIEGWYLPGTPGYPAGSLSYRNNNPGNLTFANQPGATPVQVCNPTCTTFADFDTVADGQAALDNQIEVMASRGETIQQAINIYAPAAAGNNPQTYAAQIAAASGLTVNDPLSAALGTGSAPASAAGTSIDTSILPGTDDSGDDDSGDDTSTTDLLSSLGIGTIDPTVLAASAVVAARVRFQGLAVAYNPAGGAERSSA